jgi:gliding motility-associated-like protein
MSIMRKCLLILYCLWLLEESQAQCSSSYANLIGSILEDEKGYSLTAAPDGQSIYVGGIKKDSAVILKISVSGTVAWSRTFDIVPGKQDHIHKLFVDTEGMIAVAGTAGTQTGGGTVFAMRYNPVTNTVLWANEYVSTSTNFCLGMIEKQSGGNYLMSNNPSNPNVAELIELDKTSGAVITGFSKQYDMGSSEAFYDFTWNNGMLYACGRFSDGGSVAEMRNTLARINTTNGSIDWMKLGHRNASTSARLYGFDLVIVDDFIYSVYSGDDNGSSVDITKIYLQKVDLSGNLLWIKEYDFPGANDWGDEMVYSDGGLVILGRNRVSPSDMYMFKADTSGSIVWSYVFDFFANDNATPLGSVQSQLIEAGNHLFFTAYAEESGPADMILVKTGLDGRISDTCLSATPFLPVVALVTNPVFYNKLPIIENFVPQRNALSVSAGKSSILSSHPVCITNSALNTTVSQSICEGDIYEGYAETGFYVDTFLTTAGCDSIRTLELNVVNSISDTLDAEICPGYDFEGYTDTGIYRDTFSSAFGCDSIRILLLQVTIPSKEEQMDLCAGSSYNGYTTDTMYTDTLQGTSGACDTIRNLTIHFLPPVQANVAVTICAGENYDSYTMSGWYSDTLKTAEGCDSVRTVQLSVEDISLVSIEASVCDEQAGGYKLPGTYTDTLLSVNGCDSIRTRVLYGTSQYIPNVFSPNDDGQNDVFTLFSFPSPGIEVDYFAIFDRMGNMAYEVMEGEVSWNGKDRRGRFYNPGVFAYVLKYHCNLEAIIETGNITLIR